MALVVLGLGLGKISAARFGIDLPVVSVFVVDLLPRYRLGSMSVNASGCGQPSAVRRRLPGWWSGWKVHIVMI